MMSICISLCKYSFDSINKCERFYLPRINKQISQTLINTQPSQWFWFIIRENLPLQRKMQQQSCSNNSCSQEQQAEQCQKLLNNEYFCVSGQCTTPRPYTLNQLDQMIQDVNQRYELVSSFTTMWEQRIKLEYDYADKLKSIYMNCPLINNLSQKPTKPTELFFTTLLNILTKESSNHLKLAEQLNDEVLKKLKQETFNLETQNKRNITLAKSLKKDLESEQQQLEKIRHKFLKKSNELQKLKLDYINATLLQDRDFQRKNKLFLKIKQLQSEVFPLKKTYESNSMKFNDSLSTTLTKFSEVCKKVEQKQMSATNITKNSLINSQLFVSALGAILVHQTQAILSYLDPISIQTGEVSSHSCKQVEEQKAFYQIPFQNPSQYIDESFRKIENSSIEELILYGKNPEYKRELNLYFENSHCFDDFKNLKVINCYTVRIIQIFKSVFQGKDYSSSRLLEFGQLIKTKPSLRKDFIFCLQKYRLQGKFNITKENLDHIIELLKIFLDICAKQLDTYNSKQFMVLSFTYHFINEEGHKIDLQAYVKDHKIWKNIKWWQSSLLQSIYQEHKVKKRKSQTNPTFSLWDIKSSSMKKIDNNQENSTIANICFNQLAYYVHNMQLFDFHINEINNFTQKYTKIFGLSSRMINDLQTMCQSFKETSSPQKSDKNS